MLDASDFGSRHSAAGQSSSHFGGIVCRLIEGRRQWLHRDEALFAEWEWSWSFEAGEAFVFAGYGCAEAVAEILTRNGEGQCYSVVCKKGTASSRPLP